MKVDIQDLLKSMGLENEVLYEGKRLIKKYPQTGDHKSHCAVIERHDNIVHLELKAGLTGHTPDAKELRQYPVSFQAATYIDVKMDGHNDNEGREKEDDKETRGKAGGGGGKKPAKRELQDSDLSSLSAFSKGAEGLTSSLGEIKKFVIMGKEIAKEAYEQAFENLRVQLAQTKIMAMDLMKGVSNIIQKATPGGGLAARGDETIKYKYDAERTAGMFGGLTPS